MHSDINFLIDLVIILIAAGAGTIVCKRFGQPRIVGQILAGILIGSSVFGFVNDSVFINNLAEIGVILLMFLAGLETDYNELKESFEKSSLIAIGGIIFPFALGVLGIYIMKDNVQISEAVFLGVILTATSMGITVQSLNEMRKLKTKQGVSILGAAIIDDIVGIIILTIVLGIFGQGHTSITVLLLKILSFFIIISFVRELLSKFILKNIKIIKKIKPIYLLSISLILALLFASFASDFGLAAIIGAYFIGVILSTTQLKHRVANEVSKFGHGFFIPIFFVNIGLGVQLNQVFDNLGIAVIITIIGIISKIIGSGIGAKLSGFSKKESLQIGISMVPRAEVALIVANLGVVTGFIGNDIFTSIILLVIVSTILTPIMLKKAYEEDEIT
ncbi:cation:proton antiporter [Vallitalea okinawensis]|uniref:cation:proton antiporter n=1 Tax=Vallitalea okinawensis TaxID=2078660 RepID=UPI000CFCD6D3|nr:cation:proton antiporter [Vallitalea okinawensis]